jgi:Ni,Fe-hydrogenase III large subunit
MTLLDRLQDVRSVQLSRPWPRATIGEDDWTWAGKELHAGRLDLIALWAEPDTVHLAVRDPTGNEIAVFTLPCSGGRFPSLAKTHAPAARLERTIRDLFGLEAVGSLDTRPWLDHGRWGVKRPLWEPTPSHEAAPYAFLPTQGDSLHRIVVGPVHAGIIEPGFFQFTAGGETIVRLEERLGYVHKGIEGLMSGAGLNHAIKLAGRTSGDSTVGYSYAFAMAAEAALGIEVPERAIYIRALMAELERIANHFGDFGAICNDASFAIMQVQCAILREHVLRAAHAVFGHRMMRDRIAVGGVAADLDGPGTRLLVQLASDISRRLPRLVELYDKTASLQDRTVGTGILTPALARQYACGGVIGRASGRSFDARKAVPYPPYGRLDFDVPTLEAGDVDARVWIRIREIEQSVSLIRQILDDLPSGPLHVEVPEHNEPAEGAALVEGFRGDLFVWMKITARGSISRCHLRDPSWFQWPLLEAAIEGNIVADFPLCNKSFNCSYSGHDL